MSVAVPAAVLASMIHAMSYNICKLKIFIKLYDQSKRSFPILKYELYGGAVSLYMTGLYHYI